MSPPTTKETAPHPGAAPTTDASPSRPSYPAPPPATQRARDLERRIAGILEGLADDPVTPRAVREVDRIRSAAVAIIEAKLPAPDEVALLMRLLQVACQSEVPFMSCGAILEELRPDPPRPPSRPYAIRARQLRRAGYRACPLCHLDVIDEATVARWEQEDAEAVRHLAAIAERREHLQEVS